jgi:son of sevenless-like protein
LDPADIAEQLCLIEHKLYRKIRPQECINWTKTQSGPPVSNLQNFVSAYDRLVAWVKMSILTVEPLGRRADTVEFWIKVTEACVLWSFSIKTELIGYKQKCRQLQNFSAMMALLSALSSTTISRLHVTWANAGRRSHLDPLLKFNDSASGFAAYRALLRSAEGPCLPFLGMHFADIARNNWQMSDIIPSPSNPDIYLICFLKRRKLHDMVSAMLQHQTKVYNFAENESTRSFIQGHLQAAASKAEEWFWETSLDVQKSELPHADMRKGFEAVGF